MSSSAGSEDSEEIRLAELLYYKWGFRKEDAHRILRIYARFTTDRYPALGWIRLYKKTGADTYQKVAEVQGWTPLFQPLIELTLEYLDPTAGDYRVDIGYSFLANEYIVSSKSLYIPPPEETYNIYIKKIRSERISENLAKVTVVIGTDYPPKLDGTVEVVLKRIYPPPTESWSYETTLKAETSETTCEFTISRVETWEYPYFPDNSRGVIEVYYRDVKDEATIYLDWEGIYGSPNTPIGGDNTEREPKGIDLSQVINILKTIGILVLIGLVLYALKVITDFIVAVRSKRA